MNEKQILQRKILLKGQALSLIRAERDELRIRLLLIRLKEHYERQIRETFNPTLSKKIDCVASLLESEEVRPNGQ